jgi:polyhydroxyalkanoate synthesis regulator phasin
MFRKLCGDHFIKNVVLTTTMWPKPGEADEDVNLYIDRENNLIKEFWSDMFAQGSNIFRFDATPKSAWDIINYLIVADTEKRWLQIRTKLVEEGKMLAATEEGRDVLDDLLGKLSELLKRIDGSEVGEDAIKNVSRVNEFRQLHNKALKQIRQLEADPSRLDESLLKRLIALLTRESSLTPEAEICD